MNISEFNRVRKTEDIIEELNKYNECVKVEKDAYEWLMETAKKNLDKKVTKRILDKKTTKGYSNYTYHEKVKDFGNGLSWRITMGDFYGSKTVEIEVCENKKYSNGEEFIDRVKDYSSSHYYYTSEDTFETFIKKADVMAKRKEKTFTKEQIDEFVNEYNGIVNKIKEMSKKSFDFEKVHNWSPEYSVFEK